MTRRIAGALMCATALAVAACGSDDSGGEQPQQQGGGAPAETTPAKDVEWQMQVLALPNSGSLRAYEDLVKTLDEQSGGSIKLKISNSLGLGLALDQMVSLTQNRTVDVGELIGSSVEQTWPELSLTGVQGLFPYSIDNRRTVLETVKPFYEKQAEQFNQVYMGACQADPRTIISSKEVTSLADLEGLKVRTTGDIEAELTRKLGAEPVTNVDATELYSALQTGVVDAAWATSSYFFQNKFHEVAKYVLNTNLGGATQFVTINKDAWDEISPEQQQQVKDSIEAFEEKCLENIDADFNQAATDLAAAGATVTDLTPADQQELDALTAPLPDEWAKSHGPDAQAMVDAVKTALG